MNKQVIIIGAGGHGKVVADIILKSGDRLLGFLDDSSSGEVCGFPILGKISDYIRFQDARFIIAIGNPVVREKFADLNVNWYTAIHPDSVISSLDVVIGEGSVVMANAVINSCAKIGRHSIINTSAVVEHDNVVGNFSHISVGAKLGGTVNIGDHCLIGIGATVKNNITIYDNSVIGAGAVVIKDIKEQGTYVGVPAGKIK